MKLGPGGIEPPYYNYRLYALPLSYDPFICLFTESRRKIKVLFSLQGKN